jgi:predicted RNA binding protein YcfA (HicA-like mRNA interferase family)/predicted RNase H-like HicB family nuclease
MRRAVEVKIRDVIKRLEDDGWSAVRQRGSHRQFKHPSKPGLVTIAGKPGDDGGTRNAQQHPQTSGAEGMKYLIVIEKTATGYSAYSPDLPGCIATAATEEDVQQEMTAAMSFHLDGLRQEGIRIPEPRTKSSYVEVAG